MSPVLFYPGRGEDCAQARAVCEGCSVRADCLDYALKYRVKFGIWGGTTELERRHIRRSYVVRKSARIVIPVVQCPACGETGGVVPRDLHHWLCLDCRVYWPAVG